MASSIIDNQADNTLLDGLKRLSADGHELSIATAFFSLNALLLLADTLTGYQRIRILFGDDADAQQRRKLLEMLRLRSDAELLKQRETHPQLAPLRAIEHLFTEGRIEARCYTTKKFHAKAYLVHRPHIYPNHLGVIGSGNFTFPGLLQNIELNVELTKEQLGELALWYEARWEEAAPDVVTEDLLREIRRQITLYDPFVLYAKALALWGERQQDLSALQRTRLVDQLDPHQWYGFSQALKIIAREHGVMVCDGVGLGKSFVALALMEHFCRQGQNVLLIAPKSVYETSWRTYLDTYLWEYQEPFNTIRFWPMTKLGFDPEAQDSDPERLREKREEVRRLYHQAHVVVIDESHNFRTTSADRYTNLYDVIGPFQGRPKATILLTATPINTAYRDLSAQMALITHDWGSLGGYRIDQIKRLAADLDRDAHARAHVPQLQMQLSLAETSRDDLEQVLESVVIQRSRKTCKQLSEAVGKPLRFPSRRAPVCVEYTIGPQSERYRDLITLAHKRFQPLAFLVARMRQEVREADAKGLPLKPARVSAAQTRGIKLAAFLTEQYRRVPAEGRKAYLDEVHLTALVFSNTLKQLESSPVAFQGILQNLAVGLLGRLHVVLGAEADAVIVRHQAWTRTPLFPKTGPLPETLSDTETPADTEADGETLDASGEETDAWLGQAVDEWLGQAVAQRQLPKKMAGFREPEFDTARWRDDILSDLEYLEEIHTATLRARQQPDPKLEAILPYLQTLAAAGSRILLFTQSQRTAEYLEDQLQARLPNIGIARIDSRVQAAPRAAILYAFCPGYNPTAHAPSVPARIDLLISTDVLSEGVNLQEAGAIVNYDIHWNPVRLIQRIGRVDRRLDPAITPDAHAFGIYNVLPPPEIDNILDLVGAVEERTIRISRTLGLDEAFFKSNDPAGTLKEFNALCEGETTPRDAALIAYARQSATPDPKMQALLEQLPPGAFGVWDKAPCAGLFALFTLQFDKKATPADREAFASLAGRPVLALERPGQTPLFDPGQILDLLGGTVPGQPSGTPSDEAQLSQRLKALRHAARQQFAVLSLPRSITPHLVCWMELKTPLSL